MLPEAAVTGRLSPTSPLSLLPPRSSTCIACRGLRQSLPTVGMRRSTSEPLRLLPLLSCLLVLCVSRHASAALTLPNLFSSDMVLQRSPLQASLWGTADPHALITVTVRSNTTSSASVTADGSGHWRLLLPAQPTSADSEVTVSDGASSVVLSRVAWGDVFLCSGQSNMQANLDFSFDGAAAVGNATRHANIRLFNIPPQSSDQPVDSIARISYHTGWALPSAASMSCGVNCTGGAMGPFSAVCWYTAAALSDSMNGSVPIGLVQASYGGTVVEAWTSLEANARCGPIVTPPGRENNSQNQPAACYNAMIHPLLSLTVRAVLWFQGENNRYSPERYGCAFRALIEDWRSRFRSRLPFYFVLLAAEPDGSGATSALRAGQLQALRLRDTGVASAIDAGDKGSPLGAVHSRNKTIVGQRLALLLRRQLYGQRQAVDVGPALDMSDVLVSTSADGQTLRLLLEYRAMKSNDGLRLMPTPNCSSCCDLLTSGLLAVQLLDSSPPQPLLFPAVAIDPVRRRLTANVSLPQRASSASALYLRLTMEWDGYPQCALYNAALLPSLPWEAVLAVHRTAAMDGQGEGDDSSNGGWRVWAAAGCTGLLLSLLLAGGLLLCSVRGAGLFKWSQPKSVAVEIDSGGEWSRLKEQLAGE